MTLPFLKETSDRTVVSSCGITLDLSRQRLTQFDLDDLIRHAGNIDLQNAFRRMCAGEIVNKTENRAALHTSLRAFDGSAPFYDEVVAERDRMLTFAERIRSEGKIKDVINIGIGGSEIGPHAVWHALQPVNPRINLHFLSTVDGTLLDRILTRCKPESTLAIVSSKSFTTLETKVNAKMVDAWFADAGIVGNKRNAHIVTVSSKGEAAETLGLHKENGFKIWPWVGGRFSVWSAIGLPLAIGLGRNSFLSFLRGANAMDKHTLETPILENIPILMALLAYWDSTKLEIPSLCLVPYDYRLDMMASWLQQLEMESLGKYVLASGDGRVHTRTGQGVWGSNGNCGQHSFYQWLREGTWCTSINLVKVADPGHTHEKMARVLSANADAQVEALVSRLTTKCFNSLMVITLDSLSPAILGAMMSAYENKTVFLGRLLDINPFDQPGVKLGKEICQTQLLSRGSAYLC